MNRLTLLAPALCLMAITSACAPFGDDSSAAPPAEALRIYTRDAGIHRVTYEELVAAGLPEAAEHSADFGLTNLGEPVPLRIDAGDDGIFGPGDGIEFVAEILHGTTTWRQLHTLDNVYRLDWSGAHFLRMEEILASRLLPDSPTWPLHRSQHLEEDRLLIRIESYGASVDPSLNVLPEPWFWAKLTHADPGPFAVPIDLTDLARKAEAPISLRIQFRALSRPRQKADGAADHEVAISLGGDLLDIARWDGKEPYLWQSAPIAAGGIAAETQTLELKIPRRRGSADRPLIDVVMLDWVEVDYPFSGRVRARPIRVELAPGGTGAVRLTARNLEPLIAYGNAGSRITAESHGRRGRRTFPPPPGETSFLLTAGAQSPHETLLSAQRIETERPSDLADTGQQADYLMIAHESLLEAARPLAEFHRDRGLTVTLIDIQSIYDEFSYGIVDPRAIRAFVRHAYLEWQSPAPRFVLLVGDASWDTRNTTVDDANYANWSNRHLAGRDRFPVKETAVYADQEGTNRRDLIPTWTALTPQGHAASDNYFVSVGGVEEIYSTPDSDDYLPDLAIGRLPVSRPEEVAAIVAKTIRRVEAPVGPWRRRILWITNDQDDAQLLTETVAELPEELGFVSLKVYPQPEEADNSRHQTELIEAFDSGQALVHFYGHGGRFIWRTGPPDIHKNHDLFGLDQLDDLAPNDRLPVVLSMSCFTAPFDHPNADSIGEKFLRLPNSGAVAVLGASWRNNPTAAFSQALVRELTRPGTVGEAIQAAKHATKDRIMIQTYNLLGDPAIPNPIPPPNLELDVTSNGLVTAILPRDTQNAQAIVEWLDAEGSVLASRTLALTGSHLEAAFAGPPNLRSTVGAVRVYFWDEAHQTDGLGRASLPTPPAGGMTTGSRR